MNEAYLVELSTTFDLVFHKIAGKLGINMKMTGNVGELAVVLGIQVCTWLDSSFV